MGETKPKRTCAYPPCGKTFTPSRPHVLYCCNNHANWHVQAKTHELVRQWASEEQWTCPNGPDEYGGWPCDPVADGEGMAVCSVCNFVGTITEVERA